MKKIFSLIFNRWTMTILGIIAVCLIIWFVGPLIAIAEYHPLESAIIRWILICLLVLIYVGQIVWKFAKAKLANRKLFEGVLNQESKQEQPEVGAEEVAVLKNRLEEAVNTLKKANLANDKSKGGIFSMFSQRHIYELPWYIIIGAPGSGKTVALTNSGLQFPLASQLGSTRIQGVGGTRNCDWWFTNEAILIDTAGRYTTQESDQQADSAAWTGFLQLLKKHRPHRPVNGIMLTISASELLQQTPAQREVHAQALRKRIQELHEHLGIRFPIYVFITKADLLAGFMEFFGNLGADDRTQVWGMTFPFTDKSAELASPLSNFGQEFSALEKRINDRLIDRLQEERDVKRRAMLYTLPQQFASLKDLLTDFLDKVFSPSRFEEKPLLRGVYFISGTQEGSPIDRIMGSLGRAFKLPQKALSPMQPTGKSFFITRLFRDVIFAESELAGTNLRWERQRAILQWTGLTLAALITVGGILAWSVSYARNKTYVTEVNAKAQKVSEEVATIPPNNAPDVISLLPALGSVQNLANTPTVKAEDRPFSMGFGLYQGKKLLTASNNAYLRLLHDSFLPRISTRIEEQLRTVQNNPEAQYETLKAYIMLHDSEHFDAEALRAYIQYDWENNLPRNITSDQRDALNNHLNAVLSQGAVTSPIPADAQLIENVRTQLLRMSLAQRAYSRLKRLGVGSDIPEFTISRAAGASAPLVFKRASNQPLTKGIPGIFSYKGYYEAFQKQYEQVTKQLADEEGWVLGIKENSSASAINLKNKQELNNEVRRLYLTEYADTWDAFINDIRVVTGKNITETLQSVKILSAPDSPLPELLRKIVKEVTLVKKHEDEKTLLDKGEEKLKARTGSLGKIFGNAVNQQTTTDTVSQPESIVDDRFDSLRRMVTAPAPGQPAPVDGAVGLMKDLYVQMIAAKAAIDSANIPPPDTASNKVKVEAGQMPEPLRSALLTVSTAAANQVLAGMKNNVSEQLASSVSDFCTKAIAGRYPFSKASHRDVTQDDFARIFSPGGLLDDFFQKNLITLVDTSTKPWSYRQLSDKKMSDTTGALIQFQRAQTIRDVFFRNGNRTPGMRLDFKPIEMDASITQFILDVDGQIVKYSHGPQVPQTIQWPGPKGSSQVRVQLTPAAVSSPLGPFEGPWALFRMFDNLKIEPTSQPEKFMVTFTIEGRKAKFEVVSSSVQNPFRLRELEQFQCPRGL